MKTVQDLQSIQSQAILRLNCPGYGQTLGFSRDSAGSLSDYRAIIVNPLSILHLFDIQLEVVRQIDMAVGDGLTSFKLDDDRIINQISTEISYRSKEIVQFVQQGGLLVYYLCRPFVLVGSSKSMDNYAWLGELVPDQSGNSTMSDQTMRHMSTVAHGRNVDKTPEAENTEFSKYFDQPGLEWNTIIRTEFLSESYVALALAGPKKCIAGQLKIGNNGGQVVFLPAPYSPDFDRSLIDCIYQWHKNNLGEDASQNQDVATEQKGAERAEAAADSGQEVEIISVTEPLQQPAAQPASRGSFSRPSSPSPPVEAPTSMQSVQHSMNLQNLFKEQADRKVELQDESLDFNEATGANGQEQAAPVISPVPTNISVRAQQSSPIAAHLEPPSAEENSSQSLWATNYALLGIDRILEETKFVRAQMLQLEKQIAIKEETIGFLEAIKVPLLTGKGGSLLESCKITLNALGWASKQWGQSVNELILIDSAQPVALTRIAVSQGQTERGELAHLAESMINYWNEQTHELKGILIACPFTDTPFDQRSEPDFADMVIEFARRKNICLLSTLQLLYINRDIRLAKVQAATIRQAIIACSGCLPGFVE